MPDAIEVRVPDIGDVKEVTVIELLVRPGDAVKPEDPLVTLESEKATMDVPSPAAGTVRELKVKKGDRVAAGVAILLLEPAGAPASKAAATAIPTPSAAPTATRPLAPALPVGSAPTAPPTAIPATTAKPMPTPAPTRAVHASPSVRKVARELGVDLGQVAGSGPQGRIRQQDVRQFVKERLSGAGAAASGAGLALLPWPQVDFARFGPVEARPLSRIKKLSGANLARNWVMVPHVAQFEEADITDLEPFRQQLNREAEGTGVKVTLLAFLVKAVAAALRRFPELNASIDGESLVLKRYCHVGFAADTSAGLVVPVLRDADKKGLLDVARELGELAARAREGKLLPADLQGGTFTISSLGGIGGTAFTPIVNAPEVAILGVSRSSLKPVWNGKDFEPRLMLPLSLCYDHRVVDGALGARFVVYLAGLLADFRRVAL